MNVTSVNGRPINATIGDRHPAFPHRGMDIAEGTDQSHATIVASGNSAEELMEQFERFKAWQEAEQAERKQPDEQRGPEIVLYFFKLGPHEGDGFKVSNMEPLIVTPGGAVPLKYRERSSHLKHTGSYPKAFIPKRAISLGICDLGLRAFGIDRKKVPFGKTIRIRSALLESTMIGEEIVKRPMDPIPFSLDPRSPEAIADENGNAIEPEDDGAEEETDDDL